MKKFAIVVVVFNEENIKLVSEITQLAHDVFNCNGVEEFILNENEVRELFRSYEIFLFTEHKTSGLTPLGIPHDWHIFSVVAKKICKSTQSTSKSGAAGI